MTTLVEIPFLSSFEEIENATRLLIAKRGVVGYASLLKKMASLDLFFSANKADDREQAIHRFILEELVKLYKFKDSSDLLDGGTHRHSMARSIGIYFLKENSSLNFPSISILYRKSESRLRAAYKEMTILKDAKGNTDLVRKFKNIESSLKIYKEFLSSHEKL